MDSPEEAPQRSASGNKLKVWFKRIGLGAFLFFLVKGLVWIVVFLFFAKSCQ